MSYGLAILDYRRRHNLTRTEMAKLVGCSWRTINCLETGEFRVPRATMRAKLDRVLADDKDNSHDCDKIYAGDRLVWANGKPCDEPGDWHDIMKEAEATKALIRKLVRERGIKVP